MEKQPGELKNRDLYLNRLIEFQDKEPVKVITGIRRCGKSSLLRRMARHLRETGVKEEQIIAVNCEAMEFQDRTAEHLYYYVKERLPENERCYLLLDEIQVVHRWEDAVNAFRVEFNADIYVTGSNASLLSSEYATYLSGRYVEIKMLPLSFREFLDFHGYSVEEGMSPFGEMCKRITDSGGHPGESEALLDSYLKFGGMPGIADVELDKEKALAVLDGVYSSIIVRDILEREYWRGQRQITDATLLRKIAAFLADNIGRSISVSNIGDALVQMHWLEGDRKKPAIQTVQAHVAALLEAYVFHEVKRYDIKGREILKTLGKFYIADLGLRSCLLGFHNANMGNAIENAVYLELLRRGYKVAIGKVGNQEVDFIATTATDKRYIQVAESMNDPVTRERELAPLRMIRDNYEKAVIAMACDSTVTQDGIKIVRLSDFLLGD